MGLCYFPIRGCTVWTASHSLVHISFSFTVDSHYSDPKSWLGGTRIVQVLYYYTTMRKVAKSLIIYTYVIIVMNKLNSHLIYPLKIIYISQIMKMQQRNKLLQV